MSGNLLDVLLVHKRSIGGFIPNVTITEQHTDVLTITDHPVQQGASINDHAFANASEVVMTVGWSNSSSLLASLVAGTLFSQPIQDVSDIYDQLLKLQKSRLLLDVVTGKRTYNNMLIKQLSTTTDASSEYSLILTVQLKQVIIVQVQTTTLQPTSVQANAIDTAATQNQGTQQPKAATNQSALKSFSNALGL